MQQVDESHDHPPVGSWPRAVGGAVFRPSGSPSGLPPWEGNGPALARLVSRQAPGLAAGQAAYEQRPLADRLHAPAIDVVDVAGLELGREPVAGRSDKPGDPALVADEHHDSIEPGDGVVHPPVLAERLGELVAGAEDLTLDRAPAVARLSRDLLVAEPCAVQAENLGLAGREARGLYDVAGVGQQPR